MGRKKQGIKGEKLKHKAEKIFLKLANSNNEKRRPRCTQSWRPGRREPVNKGWAFDGVVSGVFMTRQRQQRNELTDQSFLLACWINSSVLTVYIKL